jgi:predicted alpha/beta-fold hydrolase
MDAFSRERWNSIAVEWRSCGGEMNRNLRLYHSGETTDLEFVVEELIRRLDRRGGGTHTIFLVGFSLGGNVTTKWLGQKGERVPEQVRAAAAVSPPFDLTVSGPHMDRVLGGAYVKWFLRTLIPKAMEKERQFPGSLDLERIRQCRTFREFDTYATAVLHGFRDAEDYWARVGCGQFLEGVRRPLLLIASADDPFNPASTLPREITSKSPWLHPLFTERGGHVGFIHGPSPRETRHWAEEQVLRFLKLYAEEDSERDKM